MIEYTSLTLELIEKVFNELCDKIGEPDINPYMIRIVSEEILKHIDE